LGSLPPFPPLWLNELQANNVAGPMDSFGERDPWIELYNAGTNALPLDGFYLANNYLSNLLQWPFPAGAAINPGQFLLIWADGQPNQTGPSEFHTSFRLDNSSGSVALVRMVAGAPQIVDYLNYSGLGADQSYGDYPDGQPFDRQVFATTATPGASNRIPAVSVFINEWVASNVAGQGGYPDPADGHYDDWFELYNAGSQPANIGGFYLTDDLNNKLQWRIPTGTIIPAHGFLLVWADNDLAQNGTGTNGDLHANFQLSKSGESIGLYELNGTNIVRIDSVTFGAQNNDVSQGRFPDGTPNFFFFTTPTPRAPNAVPGNQPPALSAIANHTLILGQSLSFMATASDPDAGQSVSYSLSGAPAGASINAASGLFQWTPTAAEAPSTSQITVKATDNGVPSLSDSKSFTVVVALPPVTGISDSAGNISLSIPTIPGKSYQVQYKDNLSAPTWNNLGPSFTAGAGATSTITDLIGANHQRFYRIVVLN
jgi:hypothetical protein